MTKNDIIHAMDDSNKINGIPSIFTILGATGDLSRKKIIPSLWHLFKQNRLPEKLSIIGFARSELSNEDFKKVIEEVVKERGGGNISAQDLKQFFEFFTYHAGTFEDESAFISLAENIDKTEKEWGVCANKLFYLAVPPSSYNEIFKNLATAKLNIPCGGDLGWSRILVEKPFGKDLQSAKELQSLLSSYFKEKQIYRIDHYLFKEIVQGMDNFRFSNNLFENTWDNANIERIDLRLLESMSAKGRGSFYDSVGAFRDVGQNHLLMILASITMDHPLGAKAGVIRKNRENILKTLAPWNKELIKKNTFRAQYRDYKEVDGVSPNSETETYFAMKTELAHPRWEGIPIFMEAGKSLNEDRKEAVLTLKHPANCLLCEVGEHEPNRIVFRLEPNDEIIIHFWTKKPGFERKIEERTFSFFLYEKESKVQYVEEYAKILYAAMEGGQDLFVSPGEVEALWKFTDPVINGWKDGIVPLEEYDAGTTPKPKILEASGKNTNDSDLKKQSAGNMGIVGLGKMGGNLAEQLLSKNWNVAGFNRTPERTKELEVKGLRGAYSLPELTESLETPRTLWLMVPHKAVEPVLDELIPLLEEGDTVIDGGNSPYKESVRRGTELTSKGIRFLDAGVSGGPDGAKHGACVMVGGEKEIYNEYEPLFKAMSVPEGYGYMGKQGAGHFVKMVHNGIEYGMMQAIGEGFEVMKKSSFEIDLESVANVYNHGSVITSRLVGWLAEAYQKFGAELDKEECCSGEVDHSGEGQWTVETAKELGVPVKIIEGALEFRKNSKGNPSYTGQVVSALRHEFGGHDTSNKK